MLPDLVAVVGAVLLGGSVASAQTFSRVVTTPDLGRFDFVLAVADLNADGRDDIVAGGLEDDDGFSSTPAGRLENKVTLRLFVARENGRFRHAPGLVDGTIEVRTPVVVAADFNGDTRADLAVFDAGVGVYDAERSVGLGYGNPPQLFLSGANGRLRPSSALADAVRREHEARPDPVYSGPGDLSVKSAISGDIDGDGDTDLWIESTGSANVPSHFMVNNGDGTFTVDTTRAPEALLRNPPPEYWRHAGSVFVDLDNDGDLDLVLGQLRDLRPMHVNQFSIVLVNDGTGHYPARIELPHPVFNKGYTAVQDGAVTHFDVNGDGLQDLLLLHQRNNDGPTDALPFTGRYIQVLVNQGTPSRVLRRRRWMSFGDETSTWMGSQLATRPEHNEEGYPMHNDGQPRMHDVDRDGCADLVISRSRAKVRSESPLVYLNNGSGQFEALSPEPFAGSDRHFGTYAVPADVNGDTVIDFVVPDRDVGPDGLFRTADDFTTLVTLLNTTSAGPVRCD